MVEKKIFRKLSQGITLRGDVSGGQWQTSFSRKVPQGEDFQLFPIVQDSTRSSERSGSTTAKKGLLLGKNGKE